jgi:hypothetical protein
LGKIRRTAVEQYVGLDVSLELTSVCVVDSGGKTLWQGKCASTPEAIAATIRARAPGVARVGLESGPLSAWHWHELRKLGLPVVCLDARHAKAALSLQMNKSDRNDARGLAQIVRTGWYREVMVKSLDSQMVRTLLTTRAQLVRMRVDLANQIRGVLKPFGLLARPATSRGAATSYCAVNCSRQRGIILHRVVKWSALKAWGTRLVKPIGTKKATVAVARKLASILHRMLSDGSDFRWSAKEGQAA